jgi:thiol:disulfide interchange protein DsbC
MKLCTRALVPLAALLAASFALAAPGGGGDADPVAAAVNAPRVGKVSADSHATASPAAAASAKAASAPASASAASAPTAASVANAPATASAASASATSTPAAGSNDPRVAIAGKIPGTKPDDVHASPIPGMFEVMRGTDSAYVTGDGKYAITGDLFDLASNTNLTEARRRDARLKMLAAVPESQMVIFGPRDARHTITVFTDVDCQYCRKLHSQIAEYNRLGIRVRYLFYPRSGPNTDSWTKAVEVWCSPDRNDALTRAKRGEALSTKPCANSPVARHYELGEEFDVRGTPAIVMANGDMLPGYMPPQEMLQALKDDNR